MVDSTLGTGHPSVASRGPWTGGDSGRSACKIARCLLVITIPIFGYRTYGSIRRSAVTDATYYDGAMLRYLVADDNTAPEVLGRYRLSFLSQ